MCSQHEAARINHPSQRCNAISETNYWIINLPERQIECYTHPSGPADSSDYQERRDYDSTERIPVLVNGQVIGHLGVHELLP